MPKLVGKPPHDGEAKPVTAGVFLYAPRAAEEVLPDQAKLIGGDAAPRVVDLDPQPFAPTPAPDHDPPFDGIAERIARQVLQYRIKQCGIGADAGGTGMQ